MSTTKKQKTSTKIPESNKKQNAKQVKKPKRPGAQPISIGKTPYFCKECDRYYASSKSFNNHMRWYHENKIKPKCQICGNTFTRPDSLKSHIRNFHSLENQRYQCEHCYKTFHNKKFYRSHVLRCLSNNNDVKGKKSTKNLKVVSSKSKVTSSCSSSSTKGQQSGQSKSKSSIKGNTKKTKELKGKANFKVKDKSKESSKSKESNKTIKTSVKDEKHEKKLQNNHDSLHEQSNEINVDATINEEEKALDCLLCDITFLSKADYDSHRPYCEMQHAC